ncbi:hypothetical protein M422DRAFT_268263 [Sphaerobolus stellatus SS14]|uniref:Cytochrome P450 n=1 Tax=Sphaerobolus stellatus (strain SS14) TaxID=990650 RepID=A0A0C9UYH8_SPHS4|nr:hypothetical protein M422DRAFT_268263 [Sphaerobolus stellatus SS14]
MTRPYFLLSVALVGLLWLIYKSWKKNRRLSNIPVVGGSGFMLSYMDAFRFFTHGEEMIQEGYTKYYPNVFRVPTWREWRIIVTSDLHIEEMKRAPEDHLSFTVAISELTAAPYTLGKTILTNPYHHAFIHTQLTHSESFNRIIPDIYDEIITAFLEKLPPAKNWKSYKIHDLAWEVVVRVSNRVFVGLPICRDPEYIKVVTNFTMATGLSARIIELFPDPLKGMVSAILVNLSGSTKLAAKHIRPIVEMRRRQTARFGRNSPANSKDMLSFLMDKAPPDEQTIEDYARRILSVNFGSAHGIAMLLIHALLELASHPEYIEPIRQECEEAINTYGWSKRALNHASKLDSFLSETLRFGGVGTGAVSMFRTSVQDYMFSDGTKIPKGTSISVAQRARHLDGKIYPNAKEFQGFRLSNSAEDKKRCLSIPTTSTDFLAFGHGKHACLGRFFAAVVVNAIMIHVLFNYDLKAGRPPKHWWFEQFLFTDEHVELQFKGRQNKSVSVSQSLI